MPKVAIHEYGPGMECLGGKLFGNYNIYSHYNGWRPPSIEDTKVGKEYAYGLHMHEREWEEV